MITEKADALAWLAGNYFDQWEIDRAIESTTPIATLCEWPRKDWRGKWNGEIHYSTISGGVVLINSSIVSEATATLKIEDIARACLALQHTPTRIAPGIAQGRLSL